MTAGLVCGACGAELPPNSKFCNECGPAVAASAEPAGYKLVTVLFADVVHPIDIAARWVRSGCARSGPSWSATAHR